MRDLARSKEKELASQLAHCVDLLIRHLEQNYWEVDYIELGQLVSILSLRHLLPGLDPKGQLSCCSKPWSAPLHLSQRALLFLKMKETATLG